MMKGFMFQQEQPGLEENMSNLTSASGDGASASSGFRAENYPQQHYFNPPPETSTQPLKKKRNLPGNPDPEAEVIALSPMALQATNRFVCEICNKGFQRDQNLQLHRRGHNLPWKLKKRANKEVIRKKVYVCPERSCVHHDPSRALGDLTGIKKHYSRKHGEKKWKCEKCSKRYAVRSDWKSHSKICGTKEYRCDCGTLFSRRDSFISHRAFCDALTEESARAITANPAAVFLSTQAGSSLSCHVNMHHPQFNPLHHDHNIHAFNMKKEQPSFTLKPADIPPWLACHQPVLEAPGPATSQQKQVSVDLSRNSSIFQTRIDQDFQHQTHQDLALKTNPNPTQTSAALSFYQAASDFPHMSATALLQKATQMGAAMSNSSSKAAGPSSPAMNVSIRPHQHNQDQGQGPSAHVSAKCPVNSNTTSFGLNLSSREEMSSGNSVQRLSPFGNKAAIPAPFTVHPSVVSQPPNVFLQDMMTSLSSTTGFEEGTISFENAFGGEFSSKNGGSLQDSRFSMAPTTTTTTQLHNNTSGNESLTKDFLGLRPLSHSDILNFAGLSGNLNTSSQGDHLQHQSQYQNTWET